MATEQQCAAALASFAERLAAQDNPARDFTRTLSCTLRDLDTVFAGQLHDGLLTNIRTVDSPDAQIRLELSSDDLIALVAGELHLAGAWASGRVKVHAGVRDLLKLRSMF